MSSTFFCRPMQVTQISYEDFSIVNCVWKALDINDIGRIVMFGFLWFFFIYLFPFNSLFVINFVCVCVFYWQNGVSFICHGLPSGTTFRIVGRIRATEDTQLYTSREAKQRERRKTYGYTCVSRTRGNSWVLASHTKTATTTTALGHFISVASLSSFYDVDAHSALVCAIYK